MFIIKKQKERGEYYYLRESKRINGRVKTKDIAYLGKNLKEAKEKLKQFQEKSPKEKVKKELKIQEVEVPLNKKYNDIIELASRRSLFYPSSEIYADAPAGFWNFGPYGEAIRRKIINLWRKELVQKENMLEIYGSQIMPKSVFEASGHLKSLIDPIIKCQNCKKIYRADKLIEDITKKHTPEALSETEFDRIIKENNIKCPSCKGEFAKTEKVNLMIQTNIGVDDKNVCYLRPETCQSIFLDFARMVKTMRVTLPKGIAQVGRSFRNEISPRQSLFREIEFSQFEAEIFFNPEKINIIENFSDVENYQIMILRLGKENIEEYSALELVNKKIVSGKLIAYYLARVQQLYEKYGLPKEKLRFREVGKDERAFYAKETWDFEVNTAIGWVEVIANNYRTDYDLKGHSEESKKDLDFIEDGKKFIPHIWEISGGVDRTFYVLIDNAFKKEIVGDEERIILKLNPKIAPYDTAVLPLVNKDKLPELAKKILNNLREDLDVFYDDSGSIGRRYRRLDEIGCSFMITIDYDSLKKNDVTIRNAKTTKQIRVKIKDLKIVLKKLLDGEKLEKFGKFIN